MNRRSFLSILGISSISPVIAAAAHAAVPDEVLVPDKIALNAENAGKILDEYRGKIDAGAITANQISVNTSVYREQDGSVVVFYRSIRTDDLIEHRYHR